MLMIAKTEIDQEVIYQIRVQGELAEEWLVHFEGLATKGDGQVTTLTGAFADQASLRGLLNWLWDLNCTILSFTRVAAPANSAGGN